MPVMGITFGVLAAFFQSVAYIFSRVFVLRRESSIVSLLLTSHLLMGVGSAILLVILRPQGLPRLGVYLPIVSGVSGFYLLGQVGLFFVMQRTEASRVAPLLSFKIVFLAVIGVIVFKQTINVQQWAAIGVCVAGAVALNFSGVSLPWTGILGLCGVCVGYSLSDLYIERLVPALGMDSALRASLVGVAMSYIFAGVGAVLLMPLLHRKIHRADWLYALPYSCGWFAGMICLFICFGRVGAVYGNILQATRGIISVVIGAGLARIGLVYLEQRVSRFVFLRRLVAATLMVFAIWLFGR